MEKFKDSAKAKHSGQEVCDFFIYFTSKNGRVWESNMLDDMIVNRTVRKSTTPERIKKWMIQKA